MGIRRATGSPNKHIVCRYCAHGKVWHPNEGACRLEGCDCEAWEYGVNVEDVGEPE